MKMRLRQTRGLLRLAHADMRTAGRARMLRGGSAMLGWIVVATFLPPLGTAANEQSVTYRSASGAGTYVAGAAQTGANVTTNDDIRLNPLPEELPPEVVTTKRIAAPTRRPWNQRGVFLTPSSIAEGSHRDDTIENLRNTGGNAIIFDVKGSAVHFDAQFTPMAKELGLVKPWYDVKDVVRILHENGLYAIARYIAIKDHSLTDALPETNIRDPRTGALFSPGWIDPANEKALEYNRQIICELAASGVDEINLDYIRYSTASSGLQAAFTDEEKIGKIETFVKMAREAIDRCGPHAKLGVSTFAILGWDYEANVAGIGQDVVRFAPMLDVISPMAYYENFSQSAYSDPSGERDRWTWLVYKTVLGYREVLGPEHAWKVRPWLQGWDINDDLMLRQMNGAFDAGACGFLVWNAGNEYSASYAALKEIHVPESCRGTL